MAQRLKCLPAVQETWVRSLGQEDPLEKEMATHCSILAWKIPWTEESGRLQSVGSGLSEFTTKSTLYDLEEWNGGCGRGLKTEGIYVYI